MTSRPETVNARATVQAMRVAAERFSDPAQLAAIDARIAAATDDVPLRFARACALEDLGRPAEAERAYLEVLARKPEHFGALTNLGTMLYMHGRREVARAFYTKAAVLHPDEPMAYVNLGNAFVADGEMDRGREAYEAALLVRPDYPNAHYALSLLFRALGDKDGAQRHKQLAFATPYFHAAPYYGSAEPLDMLLLVAANGGNVVMHPFIDRQLVRTFTLTTEGYRDDAELPPHQLVFNAIGDADRAGETLRIAERIVRRTNASVINRPELVAETGRIAISRRLAPIPGARTARTRSFGRGELTAAGLRDAGFSFPLLLRSPGYHTGDHFEWVENAERLALVRDQLPGTELLAIEVLDGRGPDGAYRKYRVLFIGGKLYPLHLAVSGRWKVHYFSADMNERADYRAEDAAFLADPHGVLGGRAVGVLERITAELRLDYGGIDFGLDADGNVLVYEANATMAVFPPPDDQRFAYRVDAVARVRAAVRELFIERARAGGYRVAG